MKEKKRIRSWKQKKMNFMLAFLLLMSVFVLNGSVAFAEADEEYDPIDIFELLFEEDDLFYLEDIFDDEDWYLEEDPASSTEANVPSAEDNLKALHQYNQSVAEKIKVLAQSYPEDSEVRAIYEQYVSILSQPLPGRPTEEESRLYTEEKLSKISDQLKQPAVDYYKECVSKEPQITSDLFDIAEELGTEMFGIQYRLKSAGENKKGICRIAEKIEGYISEGESTGNPISYEEAARMVKDIVRYTQAGTPSTLTKNYFRTKELLEEKGYKLEKVRNSWKTFTKNAPYRGVNAIFTSPDGISFELQFHTAESLVTKEAEHPIYEIRRSPQTSEKEREELTEKSYKMFAEMTEPDHVELIG